MADIFISYSKARPAETIELAADLKSKGYTVWWDTDLLPGDRFQKTITEEIAKAHAAIVIWTPASVKSDWVYAEADIAQKRNVLIALRSADLKTDDIPPPFGVLHTALVTDRAAITGALDKMGIAPSGVPAEPASLRSEPVSRRGIFRWLGAAMVAASGAGGVAWQNRPHAALSDTPLRTIPGHGDSVTAIAYIPDGHKLVSGSWDQTLRLWDLGNASAIRQFDSHQGVVWCVAAVTGDQLLSGGEDGTLWLWDFTAGRQIRRFKDHHGPIWSIAILPDRNRVLSASLDATVKLWDISTAQVIRTMNCDSRALSVGVADRGNVVVSAMKDVLQSWNPDTGEQIRQFVGHEGDVKSVVGRPNGPQIISAGDDQTVRLWDLSTEHELRQFRGHTGKVSAVAASPNGHAALSVSEDKTAKLWDISTGHLLQSFDHGAEVEAVAIAPNGRTAVTGSRDKLIYVWDLSGTVAAS